MSTTKDKVLNVISELASIPKESIKLESELVADLGIDSPKALQLLVELEDKLGIEISDDDAAQMDTVADVVNYCESV